MTINFNNDEQYRQFVYGVAQEILIDVDNDFYKDIADVLIERHKEKLAECILDRLIIKTLTLRKIKEDENA